MLKIVIDSAGDIPEEWKSQYDIQVIPISIHFEDRVYLQGVDINSDDFYHLTKTSTVFPKTSQPTPQKFIEFYKKIANATDTILSVHISQKLSGTYNSAVLAAEELKNQFNIIPYDMGSGSAAVGYMCKEIRQLEKAGATLQMILARLDAIRKNINIALTLETLEYARRSGRVKALQAAIATLINIKPVIVLKDGSLSMKEMVRTRQRALDRLIEIIHDRVGNQLVNVAVVHSQSLQAARDLLQKVNQRFRVNEAILTELSIGIAANLGPGTIGIIAYAVA